MNHENLATEILRKEKKHTAFWATAFVILAILSAIGHIRKDGAA